MAPEGGPSESGGHSVLLVEDNPGDARLIEETLKDVRKRGERGSDADPDGFALSHVRTLTDGLDRLEGADVDVLLLDLGLPDSSGIETLVRCRERIDDVPIVVLTGMPERELGVEAVACGAQEYLSKDAVTPEVLGRTIEYAIERKRSERALRRRTEELAILNHLTRHDVRNDVSLVVGCARELREDVDGRAVRLVDEVLSASNHILQLTRSVEDAVEAIRSEKPANLRPVNLWHVVTAEVEAARALYDGAVVDVEKDEGDETVDVRANELLSSVFANLLGNAVRYNDKETPAVSVSMEVDDEMATVRIADNGPGVPEYRREQLFGVSSDDLVAETSVGLYLVGRLVDQYGGSVSVENREECGATFTVTLPLA